MDLEDKIESVRKDFKKGLKTRAINRLQGLINAYPNSIEFREELGKVYESVEWREKSGLYFLLTEANSEQALKNINVYLQSINQSGYKALTDLKFKGDKTKLPELVKEKLEELETKSKRETGTIPVYWHVNPNSGIKGHQHEETWKAKMKFAMAITGLLLILFFITAGIVQTIKWIF